MRVFAKYVNKVSSKNILTICLVAISVLYFLMCFAIRARAPFMHCGYLIIVKELTFALVLSSFSLFLQESLSNSLLKRTLTFIYAGGRVGGIFGAIIISGSIKLIGSIDSIFIYSLLSLLGALFVHFYISESKKSRTNKNEPKVVEIAPSSIENKPSYFLYHMISTGLFYTSILIIHYQYNVYFESYFENDDQMALFISQYTAVALTISLLIQILITNKLIQRWGLIGTGFIYNFLLLLSGVFLFFFPSIYASVFSRFVEIELRTAIRNPVDQLLQGEYKLNLRAQVKAITFGVCKPLGTVFSSFSIKAIGALFVGTTAVGLGNFSILGLYFVSFLLFSNSYRKENT